MSQNIEIIFENENFIVVNKPSGLIVNRAKTVKVLTLQDYIEDNIKMVLDNVESDFVKRNGIVHRLDKDTSGVMIVAKNEIYFIYLQSLFKDRLVKKEYISVSLGDIAEERFEIDAPIGRDPKSRFKFAIVRGEKDAQTYFERIKITRRDEKSFTSLNCKPKTGRTHQIRVHLAAFGYPVLGDSIYSSARNRELYENLGIKRLMLHSKSVTFNGMEGEKFFFETNTPDEFSQFL